MIKRAEEEKKVAEEGAPEKLYTGRKLSLDFKDADIKNILRLIAEVSNFNIITGDDVTGKITMRLVDVPWDQALDVILQARSLGNEQSGECDPDRTARIFKEGDSSGAGIQKG